MKKLTLVLLLLALMLPAVSLAYIDAYSGATLDASAVYDAPEAIYGTLNQRMATRTGPSTRYTEPGTFFSAGDTVKIISICYGSVPWVQVEARLDGKLMRVYTGLKRINGVRESDIPLDACYEIPARVTETLTPRLGPGTQFAKNSFTAKAGWTVTIMDFENGYAMCDYHSTTDKLHRFWIPVRQLDY